MIRQGDIYWADLGDTEGSEPGGGRPVAVVQNNAMNQSNIRTVIVCTLTTNLRLAGSRGNVLLDRGEAGTTKQSVVNVSQIVTLDKFQLGEYVGTLSKARVREILSGIDDVLDPLDFDEKIV